MFLVDSLSIRKIHHPAYSAWCKGKVEMMMKRIKGFQKEAAMAGFKTIDELNTAFWAWLDLEYHQKKHSATGETPNDRFALSIQNHPPKRIEKLDQFNSLFLWREKRTVNQYGKVRLENNLYFVKGIPPKTKVELRFSPFDLQELQVYYQGQFHSLIKANQLVNKQMKIIVQEQNDQPKTVSKASRDYFRALREKHDQLVEKESLKINYSDLNKKGE